MAVYVTHGERNSLALWIAIGGPLREREYSRRSKLPAIIYTTHKKTAPERIEGGMHGSKRLYKGVLTSRIRADASITQTREPDRYRQ